MGSRPDRIAVVGDAGTPRVDLIDGATLPSPYKIGTMLWTEDPEVAKREQRALVRRLNHQPFDWRLISSALSIGVSYSAKHSTAVAVGVPSLPTGQELDGRSFGASVPVSFPYRAGLYAYREGPAVARLLESLTYRPELLIFDAQGIAHPRGFGLAAHLSLLYDLPAFGMTRKRLFGRYQTPLEEDRAFSPLKLDNGTEIGYCYRMIARCDPVFASPGHRTDLASLLDWLHAVSAVRACFPASLQRAHREANRMARDVR